MKSTTHRRVKTSPCSWTRSGTLIAEGLTAMDRRLSERAARHSNSSSEFQALSPEVPDSLLVPKTRLWFARVDSELGWFPHPHRRRHLQRERGARGRLPALRTRQRGTVTLAA